MRPLNECIGKTIPFHTKLKVEHRVGQEFYYKKDQQKQMDKRKTGGEEGTPLKKHFEKLFTSII